jgi:hypothetical protein
MGVKSGDFECQFGLQVISSAALWIQDNNKKGLDIVMDYVKVVCKHIYIGMFMSGTKWEMQNGVKSDANTLYAIQPLL